MTGARVMWLGAPKSTGIEDPERIEKGLVLVTGHPGTISDTRTPHHMQISWVGLEDEAESWGVGHAPVNGLYSNIKVISERDFQKALGLGWWADRKA